jgi:hypothetical protein
MGKHSERKKFREILGRVLGQLEHRDGMTKAAVFYFLRKTKAAVVWLFFIETHHFRDIRNEEVFYKLYIFYRKMFIYF